MRQETNNEIDLLLRRLSLRQGVPQSDADLRIDSDHLDADELSAYAENVLPAAARARYTEHLADCSRCRELVVQLSASVPVVAAKETLTTAASSGVRKFLASFFSPMVLRYAVPALGLIVVAAIGFVMLRSSQRSAEVAQVETYGDTRPAASPTQPQDSTASSDSASKTESESQGLTQARRAQTQKEAQPASPPNAPPTVSSVRVEPKPEAPAQKTEEQTVAVSNAAPAQQSPKPAETVDEMRVEIQGRKSNVQPDGASTSDLAKQRSAEGARDEQKKLDTAAAARQPAKAKTAGAGTQSADSVGAFSVGEREKDRNDGVIRSVGGRRFRKQSGVWVDTAYDSGSAITNIARGSEQYRALVADEPAIKAIADQLEGTIIVVWKGRTYRIR